MFTDMTEDLLASMWSILVWVITIYWLLRVCMAAILATLAIGLTSLFIILELIIYNKSY